MQVSSLLRPAELVLTARPWSTCDDWLPITTHALMYSMSNVYCERAAIKGCPVPHALSDPLVHDAACRGSCGYNNAAGNAACQGGVRRGERLLVADWLTPWVTQRVSKMAVQCLGHNSTSAVRVALTG